MTFLQTQNNWQILTKLLNTENLNVQVEVMEQDNLHFWWSNWYFSVYWYYWYYYWYLMTYQYYEGHSFHDNRTTEDEDLPYPVQVSEEQD